MKSILVQILVVLAIAGAAFGQRPAGRPDGPARGPEDRRLPYVKTHIPSVAGGERGIAVGLLPPLKARYADGAPVVINVPGGSSRGTAEGPPEYAGLGFVEVWFAFPGGGRDDDLSGGVYDQRGPNCVRALADVILFATGRLADQQGRKIHDLVPRVKVLTSDTGLVGSSHGGNACGVAMATHGDEFPDLAFYASMESPYGEGNVNIELGGKEQGVNPAYNPDTGILDLSKLAWSPDLAPGPPNRWRNGGPACRGALFFDMNGDGRFTEPGDYTANVFVQDLGRGAKAWYSPRLVREAESRRLCGAGRPDHMPSLEEATEYWRWRDAAGSIQTAVRKCPNLAVIVYANERDHVQVAPDHPHILTQMEGFRTAGAKFIRLNPDSAYVERAVQGLNAGRELRFPDNDAGQPWNRENIRTGLEPEALSPTPCMQAAVAELADRAHAGNWSKNLEGLLYADAPWMSASPRRPGLQRNQERRPALPEAEATGGPLPSKQTLSARVADDAGSPQAPLLFCIGVHVEPLGSTAGPRTGPSYEDGPLFDRHVADLQTLAEMVERHGGKLTVQAQTPFTRRAAQSGQTVLPDLAKRGHEIALHFHEDAHLRGGSGTDSPEKWATAMRDEVDWLKRAGGTNIRYWSGGNLYPGVLDAAAAAGLDVMSDYKNPRTQRDDASLLGVNPWRPSAGPSEADLSGFAKHDPAGKVVYLPNGVFDRVDHSAMRRSAEAGGDYGYFDALTKGLELSLRAATPDRVNVFHITVHPGEFRGGPKTERPFAVIDAWLGEAIDPLVKTGKVRWATFSEMADQYKTWEKTHPNEPPRPVQTAARGGVSQSEGNTVRANITFVVNVHDFGRVDKSASTILKLIDLFAANKVKGDFYLTAPVVEAYKEKRPEVIEKLRTSGMTISYHFRPPHPAYNGFDERLRNLDDATLRETLRAYEQFHLDLATGDVQRDQPGGYLYVKQTLGAPPVCVSALSAPRVQSALLDIYRDLGARMTMEYHESGTKPEEPFVWKQGLLVRPSDFSVTRWALPGEKGDAFWWNRVDSPQAAECNPTRYLQKRLAEWRVPRAPLVTSLIHENDFYMRGGPSWQAIYRKPHVPPYDLNAPDEGEARSPENQAAIWRTYEELVSYAAKHLNVVTSAEIVAMAGKPPAGQ